MHLPQECLLSVYVLIFLSWAHWQALMGALSSAVWTDFASGKRLQATDEFWSIMACPNCKYYEDVIPQPMILNVDFLWEYLTNLIWGMESSQEDFNICESPLSQGEM